MTTPNPAWDPKVRWKVQRALNQVLFTAKDVLERYGKDGIYTPPSDVAEFGDVNGLIATGENQVLRRLREKIAEAETAIADAQAQMDAWGREAYGPNYHPHRPGRNDDQQRSA
jgi:hypothetical protein